jgi:glucan phosphoethanolaminetransferase (alkaline phosphatase superfamily)
MFTPINLEKFVNTFCYSASNLLIAGYVILGLAYGYLFCYIAFNVSCVMYDFLLDKGLNTLDMIFLPLALVAGFSVIQFASNTQDRIDNYIDKLKAQIAEKDLIIAELTKAGKAKLE